METLNFKEILLQTAVCAIACDGVIDERENEALHHIEKKSPYLSSEDLASNLDELIENCSNDFELFRDNLYRTLDQVELNIVQELTLLEISFRIIAADKIEEEAERSFIINLRKHLTVEDHIIIGGFGVIEYLVKEESEFKKFDTISDVVTDKIKKKK